MQQKKIILFLIILFVTGSAWLFHASNRLTDPNVGKNWWTIYFADSNTNNLNFHIENHSDQTTFHWEALVQNKKVREGDEKIEKGASQVVTLDENLGAGKIIIDVTVGSEKKEIYKNF